MRGTSRRRARAPGATTAQGQKQGQQPTGPNRSGALLTRWPEEGPGTPDRRGRSARCRGGSIESRSVRAAPSRSLLGAARVHDEGSGTGMGCLICDAGTQRGPEGEGVLRPRSSASRSCLRRFQARGESDSGRRSRRRAYRSIGHELTRTAGQGVRGMRETTAYEALGAPMGANPERRAALNAGVLFITATVASVVGTWLTRSLLDDPAYLRVVSNHATRVAAGALLELLAAGASVGVAIFLYPVLRRWSPALALGSVVFRARRRPSCTWSSWRACCPCWRSASGSRQLGATPPRFGPKGIRFRTSDSRSPRGRVRVLRGRAAVLRRVLSFGAHSEVAVGLGDRRHRPGVPGVFVGLVHPERAHDVHDLAAPIAVQEMVLAVWLIAQGFNPSALGSGARVD
jgi:hypothetical protein